MQFLQHLFHLWYGTCAVDELARCWIGQLVGSDEGQQGDRFTRASGHLYGVGGWSACNTACTAAWWIWCKVVVRGNERMRESEQRYMQTSNKQ